LRIDEFSATFDGSFSAAERMRFITVGFDITSIIAGTTTTLRTQRSLQLANNKFNLDLRH